MIGTSIIMNGRLVPPESMEFMLDDLDVTYGYGCYETLKVRAGVLFFANFHEERLLGSAHILGIGHAIEPGDLVAALELLVSKNGVAECNVKVMMIGHEDRKADWYAFLLPPVIPSARLYADGVSCLLFRGERHFPKAKSLSMLLSTVAYRLATSVGCYDALLVNGRGQLTEGTRTNLFYAEPAKPEVIYTPPSDDVLDGVTRRTLMEALEVDGIHTVERPITVDEAIAGKYSLALTSTSSRVLPVSLLKGPVATAVVANPGGLETVRVPLTREIERAGTIYARYLERYAERLGGLI